MRPARAATTAIVATPTSGFQDLEAPGLAVVDADVFVATVGKSLATGQRFNRTVPTWADRATEFADVLTSAAA